MAVATYTKSGGKATTAAKLEKNVFGVEVNDHKLLKEAYLAYMANGRPNSAVVKQRGQVRGGGKKPWRQKGTGNARFGSSRNPIWRGGGVAFGPTGQENYSRKLSLTSRRQALRQALSLAAKEDRIKVIDSIALSDGKTKSAANLLQKLGATKNALIVVGTKNQKVVQATSNIQEIKLVSAAYLNVYDVMNSEVLVFESSALHAVSERLGVK